MPGVTIGRNADGSPPDIEQVVIGQLLGFHQEIGIALDRPGLADGGEEYIALPIEAARELQRLLGGIAAAMTRARNPQ